MSKVTATVPPIPPSQRPPATFKIELSEREALVLMAYLNKSVNDMKKIIDNNLLVEECSVVSGALDVKEDIAGLHRLFGQLHSSLINLDK